MSRQIPRPEYPNPQWKRDSFVNLNGEWQFEIDKSASGKDRDFHKAENFSRTINVPFCPESVLSGVHEVDFMDQVWYKKKLNFDEATLSEKRIILHFGAADFETTVYVNGKQVGLPHRGGFVSFEYDITSYLKAGENDITVQCFDDVRSHKQGLGKQSKKFHSSGCCYKHHLGWFICFL